MDIDDDLGETEEIVITSAVPGDVIASYTIVNLRKLEPICEAGLQDTLEFLVSPIDGASNGIYFREYSPFFGASDQTSSASTSGEWKQRRIMNIINDNINYLNFGKTY